jgi:DNA-binding transcriptional ArsR family regulator
MYSQMAMYLSDELDKAFKALGDKTRRDILSMLDGGSEKPATVFFNTFDSAQPTISKHIRTLENAKLIHRRIDGRQHFFRANPVMLSVLSEWIHRHQTLWTGSLDRLEEYLDQNNA